MSIIFVTGASRSGTTMMNRILGSHDEILGVEELHYFGDICKLDQLNCQIPNNELIQMAAILTSRLERGLWKSKVRDADVQRARGIVKQMQIGTQSGADLFEFVLNSYAVQANKLYVCEQTPRNIYYINQLLNYFPESKIVHMIRDPRAVVASQKNRWRSNVPLKEKLRVRVNYHPWTICKLWSKATLNALDYANHPNVRLQKYEDFVEQPDIQAREVCDFIGVKYEPKILDIPRIGSSHKSNDGNIGISKDMLSKWSDALSIAEIASCERLTLKLMGNFGYEKTIPNKYKNKGYITQLLTYPTHVIGMILTNPRRLWTHISGLYRRFSR